MRYIVPKSKAVGIDICGVNKYTYIIRSDLGCYLRSSDFEKGNDLVIRSLHASCLGGYFYLAHEDEYFYIINGDTYRRVTNLNKGSDCVVYTLHPNCQGGDHYLSAYGCFYIIFESKGVIRRTLNMQKDYDGKDYPLHTMCLDGLYYWGTKTHSYFIKYKSKGELHFHRTRNLHLNTEPKTSSFHPDVINFLPGGIGITHGFTSGKWQYIKSVINDSEQPITWIKKINRTVTNGNNEQQQQQQQKKMVDISKNWNVKISGDKGELRSAILRHQVALPPKFGGSNIIIDDGKWVDSTEISSLEESVSLVMEPGQRVYCWQYKLSVGSHDILFWRDMKIEYDSTPPTDPPPFGEIVNQDLHAGFAKSKIKLYYGSFEDNRARSNLSSLDSLTFPVKKDSFVGKPEPYPVRKDSHPGKKDQHPGGKDTHPMKKETYSAKQDTHRAAAELIKSLN